MVQEILCTCYCSVLYNVHKLIEFGKTPGLEVVLCTRYFVRIDYSPPPLPPPCSLCNSIKGHLAHDFMIHYLVFISHVLGMIKKFITKVNVKIH